MWLDVTDWPVVRPWKRSRRIARSSTAVHSARSLVFRCRRSSLSNSVRVAGARALDLRAYNPVVAVARNQRGAKLRNQEATDGVGRIRADAGRELEFHGSVQCKGLEPVPVAKKNKQSRRRMFDIAWPG